LTLIAAVIAGIAAGLMLGRTRATYTIVAGLWLVVLLIQSTMPLYRHTNFSLSDPGYWVLQPLFLGAGLLITRLIGSASGRRRQRVAATNLTGPKQDTHHLTITGHPNRGTAPFPKES
jgi:hypothetical protein